MKIYLIRHGETFGNTLKRYVGTTDEELTQNGIEKLQKQERITATYVFMSPMKRCVHTTKILIEGETTEVVSDLTECDFGDFENLNYLELSGNGDYQKWIDSDGKLPFKNGETIENFIARSVRGFNSCLDKVEKLETAKRESENFETAKNESSKGECTENSNGETAKNNATNIQTAQGKNQNACEISVAFVIHNGNIMAIMQQLFGGDYYSFSVENGKGYIIEKKSGEMTWKKF